MQNRHEAEYLEEQKFNQPLLKGVLYVVLAVCLTVPAIAYFENKLQVVHFIGIPVSAGMLLLFRKMKLTLKVKSDALAYKFYPFHLKLQVIQKVEIRSISVVQYEAISEYGGWGFRYNGRSTAYTVSGTFGIRIILNTNRTILIGTAAPEKVLLILKEHNYPVA